MKTPTIPLAKVNIEVHAEDRDRIRELAWRGRRTGQNPRTMAEQVTILLDHYEQAHPAAKKDE